MTLAVLREVSPIRLVLLTLIHGIARAVVTDELPRYPNANPHLTADNCQALLLTFEPRGEATGGSQVVWRNRKPGVELDLADAADRLRDLRPGDEILVDGRRQTIAKIELYL